jgi:hypothetical protein
MVECREEAREAACIELAREEAAGEKFCLIRAVGV